MIYNIGVKSESKAFTLIELMIVVTIIGILASVGIPTFQKYLMQAKLAEGYVGIGAIEKAQLLHFVEHSIFCTAETGNLAPKNGNKEPISLRDDPSDPTTDLGFEYLGSPIPHGTPNYFTYVARAGQQNNGNIMSHMYDPTLTQPSCRVNEDGGASLVFAEKDGCTAIIHDINISFDALELGTGNIEHFLYIAATADFKVDDTGFCTTLAKSLVNRDGSFISSPIINYVIGE